MSKSAFSREKYGEIDIYNLSDTTILTLAFGKIVHFDFFGPDLLTDEIIDPKATWNTLAICPNWKYRLNPNVQIYTGSSTLTYLGEVD